MFNHLVMALLIRLAHESLRIARVNRMMMDDILDYHSDIKHLVHILNENDIVLEEFDYIVLNHVRRKVA